MTENTNTHPSFRVVTMTPAWAVELLDRNTRNRKISRANYNIICRALRNGEWMLNGEAIKIATDGQVLDGQHRLLACAETKVNFQTLLIENLPANTQDTMDTGKSRTLSDILSIRGETNATAVAALVKRHILVERYGNFAKAFVSTVGSGDAMTNHEALAWFEMNGWVRKYATPGKRIAGFTPLSASSAGMLLWAFETLDSSDSEWFWARVQDGAGLDEGHPVLALRRTFKTVTDDVKGEVNQAYLAAITIKSWNAYRDGNQMQLLRYRPGGAKPEKFPEPK